MTGLRNALGGLLLLAFSVAATLALGEAALRALDAWRARNGSALDAELGALAEAAGVAADGFNVYYLGGSTTVGVPFDPRMSIAKLVEAELGGRVDGRAIHSVVLARSGENLAFNVARLDRVLADPERFHPNLVVVYSGHNEFLRFMEPHLFEPESASAWRRWLATSRLVERLDTRLALARPLDMDRRALLDVPCATPATQARVVAVWEAELAHVIDAAAARGAPTILATAASNVSDFEPSRSVYCGPEAQRAAFEEILGEMIAAERSGDDEVALRRGELAAKICPTFAELQFRLGRVYERRGDRFQARNAYQAALDADAMPLRATSAMNDAIRRIGREKNVPVVDSVARISVFSTRPAPGYDWFVDAHHPTAAGYVQIAQGVVDAIGERFISGAGKNEEIFAHRSTELGPLPIDATPFVARFGLDDPAFRFEKAIDRGRWFARIATLRFDPADRLARADQAFDEADAITPGRAEPPLGHAMVAFLRRDAAAGDAALATARTRDAAAVDAYLATPWVRAVIERGREYAPALSRGTEDR